jgi:predicted RNA-binding protein with PUA-like domain
LKRDKTTSWGGVRNYQARNVLRSMKKGDTCFVYHSSCDVPAVVGEAIVTKEAYPDPLQFDKKSEYYDAGSPQAIPRWSAIELKFVQKYKQPLSLTDMKKIPTLATTRLLQRGNRLSVFPVEMRHALFLQKRTTRDSA